MQKEKNNTAEIKIINKKLLKYKINSFYEKNQILEKKENIIKNYIDPSLGTMLFSILITVFSAIIFAGQLLYLRLKKIIKKDGDELSNDNDIVIYSEGKQYWNVFEPLLDEFEAKNIKVSFYTSDKQDCVFNKSYQFIDSKYIGSRNISYLKLSILKSNICIMTTPNLNVFQLKKSPNVKHYIHIIHHLGSLLTYRLYGLEYYDSVICSSEYQKEEVQKLEKIRKNKNKEICVAGCTYLDNLNKNKQEKYNNNQNTKIITIAPSWGPNSLLNKYGEKLIEQLKNIKAEVTIRPHPQSYISEKKLIEKLINLTKNTAITIDNSTNNTDILFKTDVLISDFSSIILLFIHYKILIKIYMMLQIIVKKYSILKYIKN